MKPGWKKIIEGHYQSKDNRFTIRRVKSMQTGRKTEVVWEISTSEGYTLLFYEETLRDAKAVVARYY